jgi:nitrate reductase (cytochrome), electron transfer subunit
MRRHGAESRGRPTHRQIVKPLNPILYRRATFIVGAVLVTAAFSGYFMGLQQTGSQLNSPRPISLAVPEAERLAILETQNVPVATSYSEQRRLQDGPNADWENHLRKLIQTPVDLATLTNVSEADRVFALSDRSSRRAFDGAPPVVPHPIAQDSAASCLACHGPGLVIKDKVASKMSHAPYASCTQCHVPAVGPRILTVESELLAALAENEFVGLASAQKGARAWAQAPPTIPHSTLMRTDCMSCHGPQGLFGLRTPHPERQACVQCHVPGAELDQHFFFPVTVGQEISPTANVVSQ